MTAKYIPGPWFAAPYTIDPNRWIVTSHSPGPHDGEIICLTPELAWTYTDEDVVHCQANARLIARAPDLLAENERLRAALEPVAGWADDFGDYDWWPDSKKVVIHLTVGEIRAARAALAAAEEEA